MTGSSWHTGSSLFATPLPSIQSNAPPIPTVSSQAHGEARRIGRVRTTANHDPIHAHSTPLAAKEAEPDSDPARVAGDIDLVVVKKRRSGDPGLDDSNITKAHATDPAGRIIVPNLREALEQRRKLLQTSIEAHVSDARTNNGVNGAHEPVSSDLPNSESTRRKRSTKATKGKNKQSANKALQPHKETASKRMIDLDAGEHHTANIEDHDFDSLLRDMNSTSKDLSFSRNTSSVNKRSLDPYADYGDASPAKKNKRPKKPSNAQNDKKPSNTAIASTGSQTPSASQPQDTSVPSKSKSAKKGHAPPFDKDFIPRKVCSFFLRGHCPAGEHCTFKHEASREELETYVPHKVCQYYAQGRCQKGKHCTFRHEGPQPVCKFFPTGTCQLGEECPALHVIAPKTAQVCKFWKTGSCGKGNLCPFLHPKSPCRYHHLFQNCRDGDRCHFSHDPISASELRELREDQAKAMRKYQQDQLEKAQDPSIYTAVDQAPLVVSNVSEASGLAPSLGRQDYGDTLTWGL